MATGGMTEAVQAGAKQEILPKIFNRQPDKTPALMMIGMAGRPNNDLMTWQTEKYDQRGFDGVLEGADVAEGEFNSQLRQTLTGCVAQYRDPWKVTKRANLRNIAGIGQAKEAANQELKSMLHLKFRMERSILSTNTASTEGGGRKWTSWGMFGALSNTLNVASQFPFPDPFIPDTNQMYTGDLASFTEATLRGMFGLAFEQIKTDVEVVGLLGRIFRHLLDDFTSVLKTSSSTSQPRTIFRVDGNSRYVNKVIDIEFSEGKATLVTSPFLACDKATGADTAYTKLSGLFIAPDMWKRAPLQAPAANDLPDLGGGPRGFTDAFEGLQCLNPLGQFGVLTSTGTALT